MMQDAVEEESEALQEQKLKCPPQGPFSLRICIQILYMFPDVGLILFKNIFYIWKLIRDDCGMVQNIFKSHFGLGYSLKNQFWTPKLIFSTF